MLLLKLVEGKFSILKIIQKVLSLKIKLTQNDVKCPFLFFFDKIRDNTLLKRCYMVIRVLISEENQLFAQYFGQSSIKSNHFTPSLIRESG
jgi:hypothetical protein